MFRESLGDFYLASMVDRASSSTEPVHEGRSAADGRTAVHDVEGRANFRTAISTVVAANYLGGLKAREHNAMTIFLEQRRLDMAKRQDVWDVGWLDNGQLPEGTGLPAPRQLEEPDDGAFVGSGGGSSSKNGAKPAPRRVSAILRIFTQSNNNSAAAAAPKLTQDELTAEFLAGIPMRERRLSYYACTVDGYQNPRFVEASKFVPYDRNVERAKFTTEDLIRRRHRFDEALLASGIKMTLHGKRALTTKSTAQPEQPLADSLAEESSTWMPKRWSQETADGRNSEGRRWSEESLAERSSFGESSSVGSPLQNKVVPVPVRDERKTKMPADRKTRFAAGPGGGGGGGGGRKTKMESDSRKTFTVNRRSEEEDDEDEDPYLKDPMAT